MNIFWKALVWLVSPNCQSCGLCCAPGRWTGPTERAVKYVAVTPTAMRWMKRIERKAHVQGAGGKRGHMRMVILDNAEGIRCSALKGTVGEHVECTMYDHRPVACRTFIPGGSECRQVRRRAALPPEKRHTIPYGRADWKWRLADFFQKIVR